MKSLNLKMNSKLNILTKINKFKNTTVFTIHVKHAIKCICYRLHIILLYNYNTSICTLATMSTLALNTILTLRASFNNLAIALGESYTDIFVL